MTRLMHNTRHWARLGVLLTTLLTLAACTQAAPVVAPATSTSAPVVAATADPTATPAPSATVEPSATSIPVPTATSEPTATPTMEPTVTSTPRATVLRNTLLFMPGKYLFAGNESFYFLFGEGGEWSRWEGEEWMSEGTYVIEGDSFILTSLRKVGDPTPCSFPIILRYQFDGERLTFRMPPLGSPGYCEGFREAPFLNVTLVLAE